MKDTINKDWDIFVDFGKGDKFKADNFIIDNESKKIIIKCNNKSLDWVRIDALYPVKSFRK